MCPPDHYGIEYEINPWMSRARGSSSERARTQWESLYQTLFASLASPSNASLLYAITYVLMCWVAMWLLYRKGIFFKI